MARHPSPTWEPKLGDYQQVFAEQNPWHEARQVPSALAQPVERPLARHLWQRLIRNEPTRFQIVLGPRRVGKSTSLYQTVQRLIGNGVAPERIWWLRVDHPLLMAVDLGDLVRLVMQTSGASADTPAFLFLDEITYARDWDLWLKTFFDEHWPLRIAGSSSATAALRERRLESGIGRWDEQYLAPYLFSEFLDLSGTRLHPPAGATLSETIEGMLAARLNVAHLEPLRRRFLLTGGFPELLLAEGREQADESTLLLQSQHTLRADAVERAIYKDIPQAFGVNDPIMLERLLYTLAGQFTGILSPQNICQTLGGMSQPTFDRYLSYLERAFLVFALPNFSGSESSRQKRGRKLYFVDGAVRNAALQRGLAPLSDAPEMGLLIENMVAGHLHALSQQSQTRLFHWRDGNDEVDLVFDHPTHPLAFEIGMSPRHHRHGLERFQARFPRFAKRCYVVAPASPPTRPADASDGIGSLPLDLLLLAIGAQTERELADRIAPGLAAPTEPMLWDPPTPSE